MDIKTGFFHYIASISYNGFSYSGFQIQNNEDSIQKNIEDVLSKLNKKKMDELKDIDFKLSKELSRIQFAGRTDSNVHALENIISFSCYQDFEPEKLIKIFNYHLPGDIRFIKCKKTVNRINPRFAAIERIYMYIIYKGTKLIPFLKNLVFICKEEIDVKKLSYALSLFEGEHNFKNFTTSIEERNPLRKIYKTDVINNKEIIIIFIRGNSFLHRQVRMMIGTALDYSLGKIDQYSINNLLKPETTENDLNKNASHIFSVPASGLYLYKVRFADDPEFEIPSAQNIFNNLLFD